MKRITIVNGGRSPWRKPELLAIRQLELLKSATVRSASGRDCLAGVSTGELGSMNATSGSHRDRGMACASGLCNP